MIWRPDLTNTIVIFSVIIRYDTWYNTFIFKEWPNTPLQTDLYCRSGRRLPLVHGLSFYRPTNSRWATEGSKVFLANRDILLLCASDVPPVTPGGGRSYHQSLTLAHQHSPDHQARPSRANPAMVRGKPLVSQFLSPSSLRCLPSAVCGKGKWCERLYIVTVKCIAPVTPRMPHRSVKCCHTWHTPAVSLATDGPYVAHLVMVRCSSLRVWSGYVDPLSGGGWGCPVLEYGQEASANLLYATIPFLTRVIFSAMHHVNQLTTLP